MLCSTNITAPLVASFCFEPDARMLWTSDTQGLQTGLIPAATGPRMNIVSWSE